MVTFPVAEIFPVTARFPVILVSANKSTEPLPLGFNSIGEFDTRVEMVFPEICKSSICNLE